MADRWRDRLRRRLASIRVRVVLGSMLLVAAALGIAVVVTWQVLLSRLDREIDLALVQEAEELRLLAGGTDPDTGEPFGSDVRSIFDVFMRRNIPIDNEAFYSFVAGEPYLRSFDAPRALLDDDDLVARWVTSVVPERGTDVTAAGEIRWLAVPLLESAGDDRPSSAPSPSSALGTFVVVFFPEAERADVLVAVRVIAVTGVVVLVISGLLAWTLAGQVVRPVRRLTETARSIHDADLTGRIPVDGRDEVAVLGQTFNDMIERLDDGFRRQREFLDDVAHELRTPITIAQGHLDTLGVDADSGEPDSSELADTIRVVRDELERMSRYVSDLLLLAKAERPDFLHTEPVDIGELVHGVLARVDGLADRRWVDDGGPPPGHTAVLADSGRLEQAMLNLAANAAEHTADGDEIGIGARVTDHVVELWVRDTGPGVHPDVLDSLFQRHARGASERISRREGMGIGLSIVDAIARAHGGRAETRPSAERGATFTITFPVQLGPPEPGPGGGP